jgi:Mannosyltransferase (PIG-V)
VVNVTEPVAHAGARRTGLQITLKIAALAIAFRLFCALLVLLANVVFPDYQPEQFTVFRTTSPFWDGFARFDSGWYWQIARYGYEEGPSKYVPGGRSSIGFFPAYPLLMRTVGHVIGRGSAGFYMGGLIVSWTAFIAAMIALYHLARLDMSPRRAARAALLTAIFPFAFFFGAVYSESLFLASTVACFYCFRTKRWLAGGLCGAVATATRVNGIIMWPALAWIVWSSLRADEDRRRQLPWALAGLLMVGAGIGAYSFYIYRLSGHPFEWAAVIQRWGYHPGGSPVSQLALLVRTLVIDPYAYLAGDRMAPYNFLNGASALACVVAVPFVWIRFGTGYGLFMALNLWLPLSSGQFEGLGRYCSVLFPFFIWLSAVESRATFVATVVVFSMLFTLCTALFTNIHPLF